MGALNLPAALAPVLVVASGVLSLEAHAGAPEDLPVSNDAAMMGGTVLASGRTAGSFWYNPALLGRIHLSETEANAEVIGLRNTRIRDAWEVALPGGDRSGGDLQNSELINAPTTFAGASALTPRLTLGYGLFQPVSRDLALRVDLQDSDPTRGDTVFELRHRQSTQRLHFGAGLGLELSSAFHLGASVLAVYDQTSFQERLFATRAGGELPVVSSTIDEEVDVGSVGLVSTIGLRGQLGRIVWGAATVRTPTFVVLQTIDGSRTESHTGPGGGDTEVVPVAEQDWQESQLTGWRFGVGLMVGEGRWSVATDLHADTGTPRPERPIGSLPSMGARLGTRVWLNKRVSVGAGAFYEGRWGEGEGFGDDRMDQVGGSGGIELRRKLELASHKSIVFRSVFAVWYAHGFGTVGGIRAVSGLERGIETIAEGSSDATSHTVLLHLGSSLAF